MVDKPEPWLCGPMPDVSPIIAPVLRALQQDGEDLAEHTAGLNDEQLWARPFGLAPAGFQLRHIAGSVDRLATYLRGEQLGEEQMAALNREMEPGASQDELLRVVNEVLERVEEQIRSIDTATLGEARTVGRKQLPTTVMGLMVHIAEHTQRHVGQAISASKLARALIAR